MDTELDRVRRLKSCGKTAPWKRRGDDLPGGPYEARFGDNWRHEIRLKLSRGEYGVINVTDLMDHVIHHGNIMFRDTPFQDTW